MYSLNRDSFSWQRDMSSWQRDMSSWQRDMSSWQRDMSSWQRDMSSWQRDTSSWQRDMSSWQRDMSRWQRDMSSWHSPDRGEWGDEWESQSLGSCNCSLFFLSRHRGDSFRKSPDWDCWPLFTSPITKLGPKRICLNLSPNPIINQTCPALHSSTFVGNTGPLVSENK